MSILKKKFYLSPLFWFILAILLPGMNLLLSGCRWSDPLFSFVLHRGMMAFFVGGALALAGLIYQGIFRNPLADPYILGISSGAAAGAAAVFVFAPQLLLAVLVPAGAFAGALVTLAAVLFISGSGNSSTEKLLLSGVITGVIVSSILMCLVSLSDAEQLAGVTWWMLGDLQGGSPVSIGILAAVCAILLVLFRFFANDLNVLSLGDDEAALRGVQVRKVRLLFVTGGALLSSICVSLAGIIGFAGLVVPHIIRLLNGCDHRKNLLLTFVAGGFFLQFCDTAAMWLSRTREIPVGVTSACIGGGIFLFLLARHNRGK